MSKDTIKITFIGDISCDRPLLNAERKMNFNFAPVFVATKELFKNSDYVCANFETVCAGMDSQYKDQYMLCNAPDELVEQMSFAGINFVTTANNHCCDGGIEGIIRTLNILDKYQIDHDGTYVSKEDSEKIFYKRFGNITVAFIAATYSTNESNTGLLLDESNDYYVRLLRRQQVSYGGSNIKKLVFSHLNGQQRRRINRVIARVKLKLGLSYLQARTDTIMPGDEDNSYLTKISELISEAKTYADYVFVCPHFGGQFNTEIGEYSKFLGKFLLDCGATAIIGNHPHVIQRIAKYDKGGICAYSLGGFNQSISADYIIHDAMPEYSIALHFYLKNQASSNTFQTSFSFLKNIEEKNGMCTIYPVFDLYGLSSGSQKLILTNECRELYKRITGKNEKDFRIEEEYWL